MSKSSTDFIDISLQEAKLADIALLRAEHLEHLNYSQEYFLEAQVRAGICYTVQTGETTVGYFILSDDGEKLLEYFVRRAFRNNAVSIFSEIISQRKFSSILSLSFDHLLMKCCLSREYTYRIGGTLFREYSKDFATIGEATSLESRWALPTDFEVLQSFEDLADNQEELQAMLANGNLNMFFDFNETLVGCGYIFQIIENKNYFDIGMWVHPDKRRKGIAKQILNYQKQYCLERDYVPVCGCAADNIPSRKAIESCGFISSHDLLIFDVAE